MLVVGLLLKVFCSIAQGYTTFGDDHSCSFLSVKTSPIKASPLRSNRTRLVSTAVDSSGRIVANRQPATVPNNLSFTDEGKV